MEEKCLFYHLSLFRVCCKMNISHLPTELWIFHWVKNASSQFQVNAVIPALYMMSAFSNTQRDPSCWRLTLVVSYTTSHCLPYRGLWKHWHSRSTWPCTHTPLFLFGQNHTNTHTQIYCKMTFFFTKTITKHCTISYHSLFIFYHLPFYLPSLLSSSYFTLKKNTDLCYTAMCELEKTHTALFIYRRLLLFLFMESLTENQPVIFLLSALTLYQYVCLPLVLMSERQCCSHTC